MQFRAAEGMAWLTSAVALIVGAIGMLNTMAMSVFERTGELGLLRAVGWRKRRVIRMILAEAEVLSVSAAVLGTLAARLLTRFLANVGPTRGLIEGRFDPDVIARGFLVAVLLGLVGALYPALRAASLAPTEALRNQ
jgi:putative ABC transport system permease protein